ncbi:chitin deacetylase 1-like [Dendroctonus ponderosae]|uniref:chitin deacetylase 1-like n=1 Tax=Dendroctonus ponderosae TaxID=77166 RepID=UPI0020351D7D|nr:chitin deacetylase 1-like [Dendroctonus ponderosae]
MGTKSLWLCFFLLGAVLAQDDNESDDPTSEELCLNRPADEYFRLSTEGDCRDVVRCDFNSDNNGVTRLASVRCPVGLAFDVDRQTCDWKTNVKNCDKLESKSIRKEW